MLSRIFTPKISFTRFLASTPTLYERVNEIVEKQIRPILQMDGGDISLFDVKDGVMIVELEGACTNCRSKGSTLRNGVLAAVNEQIPEIVGIRQKIDFEDI